MIEEIKKEINKLNSFNIGNCVSGANFINKENVIEILDKYKNEPSYYYCNECKKWSDLYVEQMNLECSDCFNKKICHDNHWCIQKGCGKHCNNFKNKYEPYYKTWEELKEDISNAINEAFLKNIHLQEDWNTNDKGRYDCYRYIDDKMRELEEKNLKEEE